MMCKMLSQLKKALRYLIPVRLKKTLKCIAYTCEDILNTLAGKRDPKYPPKRLNFVGSHDFKKVGEEFLGHLTTIGNLKPHESVLDIGCGIGRIAIPLTQYLEENSRYEGFDIDKRGIAWCTNHITPTYPHFKFVHANLYNKYYNAKGAVQAKEYRFPYEDNTFDFAFATSVYTHMLTEDIKQYLSEMQRVLRPGGRYLITFFALNDQTQERSQKGEATCSFTFQDTKHPHAYFSHKTVREAEIAYEEEWIRSVLHDHELDQNLTLHPGWWSGAEGISYQDMFVGEKQSLSS